MVAALNTMTSHELAVARLQAQQLVRVIVAACDDRHPYPMLPHRSQTAGALALLQPEIPALIALLEKLK